MNVRSSSGGLVQHPDKRFGFPHLSYPSNPYLITPYDGVYAVGTNNVDVNNNPKPDNQWHVEDVQGPVADYLSKYKVRSTKYEVRSTKYEVRSAKQEVRSTKCGVAGPASGSLCVPSAASEAIFHKIT
jgi:hypothetical protein